jgi:hypothetical protein
MAGESFYRLERLGLCGDFGERGFLTGEPVIDLLANAGSSAEANSKPRIFTDQYVRH